jgi:hypothetical protein
MKSTPTAEKALNEGMTFATVLLEIVYSKPNLFTDLLYVVLTKHSRKSNKRNCKNQNFKAPVYSAAHWI